MKKRTYTCDICGQNADGYAVKRISIKEAGSGKGINFVKRKIDVCNTCVDSIRNMVTAENRRLANQSIKSQIL